MKIILYSTGCPRCCVLENKLKEKNIDFSIVDNKETIIAAGITTVPILEIDGRKLGFKESIDWVNSKR